MSNHISHSKCCVNAYGTGCNSYSCFFLYQLVTEYPKVKEKYLRDYCASAQYIMVILLKGYKFETSWGKITFQKQVCSTENDTNMKDTLTLLLVQQYMVA